MGYLSIGEMAKLNGLSEQSLRLYDRMGLISPTHRGEENGYRYYDIRQSAVLDIIQYMKSLGMSLKEISVQLRDPDINYIETVLRRRQEQVDGEIKNLKFQRRAIERTIESIEHYRTAPPDGTIVLEYIGRRQMYLIDCGINFYDYDMDEYERLLRELKDSLSADQLPQIYFCNAGTVLRQENLAQRRFYSTELFVFVDREFVSADLTTPIPASNYLCIYCDSFYKEKEYAERLLQEAEKRGYRVTGDYLCESISDIPMVDTTARGMFLRLQIPVSFA
ncbi:MAG: MerR family transcriptional regulator [Oscillospiraceae bacterium]|nr:MerR family transcriptional regulator [Oscillospiraceae bacterium]